MTYPGTDAKLATLHTPLPNIDSDLRMQAEKRKRPDSVMPKLTLPTKPHAIPSYSERLSPLPYERRDEMCITPDLGKIHSCLLPYRSRSIRTTVEQITTVQIPAITQKQTKDDLSSLQTMLLSTAVEKQTTHSLVVAQIMMPLTPSVPHFTETDDDALLLQTVPIRTIKKKRAKKMVRTFFANVAILLVSFLLLATLAVIIGIVPSPIYKAEILLVLLIAFSYIASMHMKRIDRGQQQTYLTVSQFMHTVRKKPASSEDEDRKHLKLIKQDTTAYLQALTARDLKKGSW